MFLERHYQNAYITRNLDQGIEILREKFGATEVSKIEATVDVWTPHGSGPATNKMAFAWVGNLQYELIEPVSGPVDLYRDVLPPDGQLRFHHIAMRIMDWGKFRAEVDRRGLPIAYARENDPGLQFIYIDARATLGHYLEYVHTTPERWALIDPHGVIRD
jgi:catechol 2,3-dioxygenase-like lactoylglutathione lyase family enzyme